MLPPREQDPYIGWRPEYPEPRLSHDDTALLIIDMQYFDAHWEYGMCLKARQAGFEKEMSYYRERLNLIVPNIRRLMDAFRARGMEVIHTRIQSMVSDGRDRGPAHKKLGHSAPPGSREAEILDELKPLPNELVFNKTAGSAFVSTNIEYVLRNMGIRNLVVVGVVTTGCVHTAVTDASDLGFNVILVEDGVGSIVPEMHWNSIRVLRDVYAKIMSTDEVLDRIRPIGAAGTLMQGGR
jgi:nicotinamidase-related amidase